MRYDFETLQSRKNTGANKWNGMYKINPSVPDHVVPFSVADMEFKNPPQIAEGLYDYLKNNIMGYTSATDSYYDAIISWMKRRHKWDIKKEWIVEYPGGGSGAVSPGKASGKGRGRRYYFHSCLLSFLQCGA